MSKETAVLSPTLWQMLRSARPYFAKISSGLAGEVKQISTKRGLRFWMYLPPSYADSDHDVPVLYHLHGAAVAWNWVKRDIHWIAAAHEQAVETSGTKPMIIVAPHDPSRFSMWTDSKDGSNDVANLIINDLIPHIEANFKASKDRTERFIQGFSMGGFGAATLGLKHQDLFAAITIFDGAMHDWSTLTKSRSKIARNQFGDDQAFFEEWSPWQLAQKAEANKTPVLVIDGLMEDFNKRFEQHLCGLDFQTKLLSPECLHDLRCLQGKCGVRSFEFMASSDVQSCI